MAPTIVIAPDDFDSFLIRWLAVDKEVPIRTKYVPRQGIKPAEPPYYIDADALISDHYTLVQFLQERFPGEQLLPADPVVRAQMRQVCRDIRDGEHEEMLFQFEVALLTGTPYLGGRELSMVDIYAGAWMKHNGIETVTSKEVLNYYRRLERRPGFSEQVLT